MIITNATADDYEGILTLHKLYHTDYISAEDRPDGFVTTNFTSEQLNSLITEEHGVTIAKDIDGKVCAYAMAASWKFWAQWPLFTYMIDHLNEYSLKGRTLSSDNSYQYGPVCVASAYRGTGLFQKVFFASLASMRDRYPIMATFINHINSRSYAAHTQKVSMIDTGSFRFNNNDY